MIEAVKFIMVLLSAVYVMHKLITPLVNNTKEIANRVNELTIALSALAKAAVTHGECEKHRKVIVENIEQKIKIHELECENR